MNKLFFILLILFGTGLLFSQTPVSKRSIGFKKEVKKKTVKKKKLKFPNVETKLRYKRVESHKWSQGWTTTAYFKAGKNTYLFLLKQKGTAKPGYNVHIHKVNSNGKVGTKVAQYNVDDGYTDVEFYSIKGKTYMMQLMKKGNGNAGKNVFIRKILPNGKFGGVVKSYGWSQGWSTVEFFKVKGQTYLFLSKEKGTARSGHNTHIHKMNDDGSIGKRFAEYTMGGGAMDIEFFTVGKNIYLMHLKKNGYGNSGNNVFIRKIQGNGRFGNMVKAYRWETGWTAAEFFIQDKQTYLFLLKETGNKRARIHKMNRNGTVGKKVASYNWTSGWTNVEFFRKNKKTYMLQLKEKGIGKSGYNVHLNRMINKVKPQNSSIKEDCLSFNYNNLEVRKEREGYLVTDGRSRMMTFKTRDAAYRAVRTIKAYKLTKHCFAIRPATGLRYFLVNNDIPKGKIEGEDCIRINPNNLTIRKNSSTSYSILDGNHIPFSAKSRKEAEMIIKIAKKYKAKYTCYISRPNPGMVYLRK